MSRAVKRSGNSVRKPFNSNSGNNGGNNGNNGGRYYNGHGNGYGNGHGSNDEVDMRLLRNLMRGRVPMYVRHLPRNSEHSSNYEQLMWTLPTDGGLQAQSTKSFLTKFGHFSDLQKVQFDPVVHSRRMQYVEKYIVELKERYLVLNRAATKKLNSDLQQLQQQWTEQNGEVPEMPNDSNRLSRGEKQAIKEKISEYNAAVRKVKEEQDVVVYAVPGGSNFDYLTNCIRLLNSERCIQFSIDIEAFEFDTKVITEIGISIYDPRENLYTTTPFTRNYHLIVSEVLHLRNSKYVCDYKDCFLLGESLVMGLNNCIAFVQALINFYMKPKTEEEKTWSRAFVGHNIKGDIKWLRDIGIDFTGIGEMDGVISQFSEYAPTNESVYLLDTEKLYGATYGRKGSNLGKILQLLEVPHAFLHNAGNDAHYTLTLLKKMCDVQFRQLTGLDDLSSVAVRIAKLNNRTKEEPKILPMSYAIAVASKTVSNFQENRKGKQKNSLVQQTEFGGATYFNSPEIAFRATFEYHGSREWLHSIDHK
ncbi:Good for full DBP5 activity protein 2 [Nakaseomyces bracarensis]|uniref:Good for full DBP5 activity protein 2 n=1 Tax=Nakaseomyces bracarensis TaxID=273131 RepID=A0ABR4NQB7_9SACH